MSILNKYSKEELIHIVDMFSIDLKISDLKKSKKDILLSLKNKNVEQKHGLNLPDKKTIKSMVIKDKQKKNSMLNKVANSKRQTKITDIYKK